MHRACLAFVLLASTLLAQSPQKRFQSAYTQWTSHRADEMVWHDDSTAAITAFNTMWSTAAQVGAVFVTTHPTATAKDLSKELASLLPGTDPRFDPPLSVNSLEIRPGFFLVAFNNSPAGDIFAISRTPTGATIVWNLSLGSAQENDPRHLLASWHASRAGNACITKNTYASGICGPMSSISLGSLPPNSNGQPRFFIGATYSKDMGGTDDEQISIWSLAADTPRLEWINLYAEGGEEETVPGGIEFKDGMLLIAEKDEFNSFTSCGSCSGRQMIRRIHVTPDGLQDTGLESVHPELDAIDDLFQKIFKGESTAGLASPEVISFLQPRLMGAKEKSQKIAPNWLSVGMLDGFALSRNEKSDLLCFQSDELAPVDFTLEQTSGSYFVSHIAERPDQKQREGTL